MLKFCVEKTTISVSPLFFALLTSFLVLDRNGIAIYVLIFSSAHELSHFVMMLILKAVPKEIRVSLFGISVSLYENTAPFKKIMVLSSGFLMNFLLSAVFYISHIRIFSLINLVLGIFSFLPIPSTDGGGILEELFFLYSEENYLVYRVEKIIGLFAIFALFLLLIFSGNIFLFIAIFYLAFRLIEY